MTYDPQLERVQQAVNGPIIQKEIRDLREKYRHTRLSQYKARRNLLARITAAERRYNDLMHHVLREQDRHTASLYKPRVTANEAGLLVILELSLDGTYYSNPAPVVPPNATVWIRGVIEEAHHGDLGIPRTHDMFRLRWTLGKGYTPLDNIPRTGHDVYAVCWPLVITRRFQAPGSNTKKNFLLDVYPYEREP